MKKRETLKQFPKFESDAEAEKFVDEANLAEYDFSQFKPAHFEFAKKSERVNMRLPEALLRAVKEQAEQEGVPYQRFIRKTLERVVFEKQAAAKSARG